MRPPFDAGAARGSKRGAARLVGNFWLGWATGSATALTFVLGLGEGAVVPIAILGLIAIGITLTVSPVVYKTVEKLQMAMVTLIMVGVVAAVIFATEARAWGRSVAALRPGSDSGYPTPWGRSGRAATVFNQSGVAATEGSLDFIRIEDEVLGEIVGSWFAPLFWMIGVFALFSTNLGILDGTSRAVADILKVDFLRESRFWSESKLYFTVIWTMIVLGSAILMLGVSQPLTLLVISSASLGGVMVIYIALLIVINRRLLPEPVKLGGYRLAAMYLSFAFFAFFVGWLIVSYVGQLSGG